MANNDFVSGLVKKLLVSAASAAGSKIGGAAAAYVLDLLGLGGTDDLDDIKSELDTMSDQVKKTDSKVSILMDEVKWDKTTDSFDIICATITTHSDNLQKLLAIKNNADRDQKIKQYITAHSSLDDLDISLTLINNRIMGKGGGMTGTYDAPLMKTYLETHWGSIWDKSPAKIHEHILSVYIQAAQMQRLATTLLVAYREATNQPQLAASAREHLETRLLAQYQVMVQVAPDFIMLNGLATLGLRVDFSGFQIAPQVVAINPSDPSFCLWPETTHILDCNWMLKRTGADPKQPYYNLLVSFTSPQGISMFHLDASNLLATETVRRVKVGIEVVGVGMGTTSRDLLEDAHLIATTASAAGTALLFSIEITDQINLLRLKLADGRTFGYIDRKDAGHLFELTKTEATPTNGLVILSKVNKKPVAGRSHLRAWSLAFASTPAGEGRFTPGYRVRYRVSHVNRFGESEESDWLLAPKANEDSQDSEGYFGNQTFYFPQIELAVDPTGRTEGYRIFRQFRGGAEEEVTTGTYTGDPQSGKPVIFDDFMV